MRTRTFWVMFGFAVMGSAAAEAEPVLLASYHRVGGDGIAPLTIPVARLELQLVAEGEFPPGPSLIGPFLGEGETGVFEFNAINSVDFGEFAELATNGIDDEYWQLTRWQEGGGGGPGGSEIQLFHQGDPGPFDPPDLAGNDLDFVRLIVDSIHFTPWIPVPGVEGFTVNFDLTYEFYGTIVPEPNSAAGLTLLLILFASRRNRNWKSLYPCLPLSSKTGGPSPPEMGDSMIDRRFQQAPKTPHSAPLPHGNKSHSIVSIVYDTSTS